MSESEYSKKVAASVKLLQAVGHQVGDQPIELCYSGGKDSDVILELAKMAGINYRAIYKNTTIDPVGTIAHAESKGVEIRQPKMTFLQLVRKKGLPTMHARFCCEYLKEYKILDNAIQGIRRCESTKRSKNYSEDEPIKCRFYGSKKNHVNVILPILSWTDEDVSWFIAERGIRCHPLYYDGQGRFHVERRLGCLGCPLKADRGKADFKKYRNLVRAFIKAQQELMDTHPNAASHKKFGDAYNVFYHDVFCDSYEDFLAKKSRDLFGNVLDCKAALEQYFSVKLT